MRYTSARLSAAASVLATLDRQITERASNRRWSRVKTKVRPGATKTVSIITVKTRPAGSF